MDVDKGWVAQVNGQDFFPQQSVSKTWVALSVLDAIDRGQMAFEQPVVMTQADRSVFFQPIVHRIGKNGFQTDVADLLHRALTQSDNAANDMLIRLVGGAEVVTETLDRKGLEGLRMDSDEKHLQAKVAGVPWNDNLVQGDRFRYLRSQLPDEVRNKAMQRYVENPYDGAQPVAIVEALARLKRGQLLSTANSEWMMDTMMANTTGHSRLRAGAPRDWEIGDKTGTGQDWDGASVGINDIALMTAPDGRTYAVAVMIQRTKQGLQARRNFMQAVSRTVVDYWRDNEAGQAQTTAQAAAVEPQGLSQGHCAAPAAARDRQRRHEAAIIPSPSPLVSPLAACGAQPATFQIEADGAQSADPDRCATSPVADEAGRQDVHRRPGGLHHLLGRAAIASCCSI